MNDADRMHELERRLAELERRIDQPPMARMLEGLLTPEAGMHLRSVGRQQLLVWAEVARGLADLIAPPETPSGSGEARDERQSRTIPVD
jgi:hypothetical protein